MEYSAPRLSEPRKVKDYVSIAGESVRENKSIINRVSNRKGCVDCIVKLTSGRLAGGLRQMMINCPDREALSDRMKHVVAMFF
eukprot:11677945-Alexandrium_andersonii.AAC.1